MTAPEPVSVHTSLLLEELHSRKAKNPHYSMRAFAKFLGLDIGAMSRILNGKQGVSIPLAATILKRLNFSSADRRRFIESLIGERLQQVIDEMSELKATNEIEEFDFCVELENTVTRRPKTSASS